MPEPFDLEALVRAARPEPAPAWAGKLDRRVAERFPSPPRWWHWQKMRAGVYAVATAATAILLLVGAISLGRSGGSVNDSATSSSAGGSVSDSAKSSPLATPEVQAGGGAAGSAAPAAPLSRDRAQIQNVSVTLSTKPADVEDVSDRVIRVADTLGGWVENSSITARESAELTLRVPSDKLQQALSQLSRIAHVSSRRQETQDVTDQRAAVQASVRDARAYRDSLRNRLAHATTDRQAASLRARLQRAEQRLRSAQRRLAALARETSYATIDVSVHGDRHAGAAVAPGGRWTPGDALHDAGRVLEFAAGVALIALAVGLPIALVALAAAAVARLLARRRRERALEMA